MCAKPSEIETPELPLRHCSVEDHVKALVAIRKLPFWWYQGTSRILGNWSLPFRDANGNWWYQAKPGFCWQVECYKPIDPSKACPRFSATWLGYQHILADESAANSRLVINSILDLSTYGAELVNAKRRNAVRKGFKACDLDVLTDLDAKTIAGCRAAWNDLTARTGWRHAADERTFAETWGMLLGVPGTSVIVGRDAASGEVAGFLITKIIGDTAYVDTIASRTDLLHTHVNDAVMYAFLINARRLPGVTKAQYAIKSNVKALERFKTSLGFVPHPFPAMLRFRPGISVALRLLSRDRYDRMWGRFEDEQPGETPKG
jgi:hypothetical protein